jgi:hypothetical protein
MKNKKEKRKVLKIRPFNMANFSGGSGYLVFSIVYQAMAMLPALVIIWLTSLIKLPKDSFENIDRQKAGKRFYAVSIPVCFLLIIVGLVAAIATNYGGSLYLVEILFIGIAPSVCTFFVLRRCHIAIVVKEANPIKMILLSIVGTIAVLLAVFIISAFMINPILELFDTV